MESEEKKRNVRLIDEGVKRMYFPRGSGPRENTAGSGMCTSKDPSYAEWATTIDKLRGWNFKCVKFFARRLLDFEQAMQRESEGETAKVEIMEASENLIEEMASEESRGGMQGGNWAESSMGGYDGGKGRGGTRPGGREKRLMEYQGGIGGGGGEKTGRGRIVDGGPRGTLPGEGMGQS